MGWLQVLICLIAAILLYGIKPRLLFFLALIVTLVTLWSWGIMHNFAVRQAVKRKSYSTKFYDLTKKEIESVPDWITTINLLFSLFGVVLLVIAIIRNIKHG